MSTQLIGHRMKRLTPVSLVPCAHSITSGMLGIQIQFHFGVGLYASSRHPLREREREKKGDNENGWSVFFKNIMGPSSKRQGLLLEQEPCHNWKPCYAPFSPFDVMMLENWLGVFGSVLSSEHDQKRMKRDDIISSNTTQIQKYKYCMFSFTYEN